MTKHHSLTKQKHTQHRDAHEQRHYFKIAGLTLLGTAIIQLLLAAAYLVAFHNPKPHDLPIAVVKDKIPVAQIVQRIDNDSGGAYAAKEFSDTAAAKTALQTQEVYAIYAPNFPTSTITIASANGKTTSHAVAVSLVSVDENVQKQLRLQMQQDPRQAAASAAPVSAAHVDDIAPLANGDGGVSLFYTAFSAVFGGYIAAVALNLVRGKRKFTKRNAIVRITGFCMTAITTGLIVAAIAVHGVDAFPANHFWIMSGILALTYFGVAAFSSALISAIGIAGTALIIVLFIILGNPASGGVVPVALTDSGPWHWLAAILPTGAAVSALRQAVYFDGVQVASHLLVPCIYAVIGVAGLLLISKDKSSISAFENEIVKISEYYNKNTQSKSK